LLNTSQDEDVLHVHKIRSAAEDIDEDSTTVPFMLPMFSSITGGPPSQTMYKPTEDDFENFFAIFCERVDPIVKILHKPSVRCLINRLKLPGLDSCPPIDYALLISIAYSATCSLTEDDPRLEQLFGETLAGLRQKVTFSAEVAMSRVNLFATNDFTALQAFTLYIVSGFFLPLPTLLVDRNQTTKVLDDNSLEVWHTLWCPVALAVRIANSMGVHKDGTTLGLSPFETEIRRRVWWHLILLSIRTSEDYSCYLFTAGGSEVSLPTNIDDDDMSPDSARPFVEQDGLTEMTASLLRYEGIAAIANATQHAPLQRGTKDPEVPFLEEIRRFEQKIQTKYLAAAQADPDNERSRLILGLGKIAVLKICWVWGFSLMQKNGQAPQLNATLFPEKYPESVRGMSNLSDELFITATKILEQQILLHSEPNLINLYWILRNIKPWEGLAIILTQMSVRLQKRHPDKQFDQLPQMLKDAWEVSNLAFSAADQWSVGRKYIDGLKKMRRRLAEMMGLELDTSAPPVNPSDAPTSDFGPLPVVGDSATQIDGMDLDHFVDQDDTGGFSDPWPMFIPMNFAFFSGGAF
jgi:hypothetical protein